MVKALSFSLFFLVSFSTCIGFREQTVQVVGNEQPIGNHKDDTQITFLFPVYVIVVASFAPIGAIGALKKLYAR